MAAVEHCLQGLAARLRQGEDSGFPEVDPTWTLLDLFRAQVNDCPDRVAVGCGETRLCYAELDRRSRGWAQSLVAAGVGRGDPVLVCLERSPDLPAALLGVMRAGACFVPVDPQFPAERVKVIVEDSQARALILDQELDLGAAAQSLPQIKPGNLVEVESHLDVPRAGGEDLAYILFTSGSTGRPKGVPIRHSSLLNFLLAMASVPGITERDRVLALTTVAFDIAMLELFLPLIAGAGTWLADTEMALDPQHLASFIENERLSLLQATPATWQMLLGSGWKPGPQHRILCGGEAFPVSLARALSEHAREVWNMYGPTEATIWVSCHRITEADLESGPLPIGTPIPNTAFLLRDQNGNDVQGPGQGELLIGGACLSLGYWRRPDLTETRFVSLPSGSGPVTIDRFYCTGDLVRRTETGSLCYLGRLDNQIKIRGYRVEPGEIETCLNRFPGVVQAAVVAPGEEGSKRVLVAYLQSEQALSADELEAFVARSLPPYMVPRVWRFRQSFPQTPNRKVDRRALEDEAKRTLEEEGGEGTQDFGAPLENELASIWGALLGARPRSAQDNFMALGGHSLLAAELSVRVRQTLHRELSLVDILRHPRLAEQANWLAKQPPLADEGLSSEPPQGDTLLPFTATQWRFWLTARLTDQPGIFHESEAYRLSGPLDETALRQAIERLVAENDAFRLTVATLDDRPQWRLHPSLQADFATEDMPLESEGPDSLAIRLRREAQKPFDLATGPLIRFRLYRGPLATDEDYRWHVLQVSAHHLIIDGLSQTLLWQRLAALYAALSAGGAGDAPMPERGFADYLALPERSAAATGDAFWTDYLKGPLPTLDMITDFPRPARLDYRAHQQVLRLPDHEVQALEALARDHELTVFQVLLGCYGVLLSRYTGQRELILGFPVAGRESGQWQRVMGLFINTLPVRLNVRPDQSLLDQCRHTAQQCLAVLAHQETTFDRIVELAHPERDPSRTPVFQALFTHNDFTARPSSLGMDCKLAPLAVDTGFTHTELVLFADRYPEGMDLRLQACSQLYAPEQTAQLLRSLGALVASLLADPGQAVVDANLVDPAAEANLRRWNRTERPYPRETGIAACFLEQAEATPQAPALEHGGRVVTYAALAQASAALRDQLLERGVRPGERIGIAAGRDPACIVGILAILRAGGVYVPLDVRYPRPRLAAMLADAKVRLLLCDARDRHQLPPELPWLELGLDSPVDGGGRDLTRVGTDPAYIMFTSGSTGRPKGIEVNQRNVLRLVKNTDFMPMGADTRFLMYAPIAFDASTLEIWAPLLNGGCLVIPEGDSLAPGELAAVIRGGRVNALWLTAALFHLMAEYEPEAFVQVRHLLAGGDVLSAKWVRSILDRHPGLTLINGYGPTENTTFSCCYPMQTADEVPRRVPIGRPIANSRAYVREEGGRLCPPGMPGELVVAGDGVANGYLVPPPENNPFQDSVVIDGRSERIYRTGDHARWLGNGVLEFLGRRDRQVKIRGYRIELAEVEGELERLAPVTQAAVLALPAGVGTPATNRQLVAFVVAAPEEEAGSIKQALSQRLPRFMCPDRLLLLKELPRDRNGKVDRAALAKLAGDRQQDETEPVPKSTPAMTETQQRLRSIWRRILAPVEPGLDDDFFDLGGSSLTALELFAEIDRQFGRNLPLSLLLEKPTIRALADVVESQAGALDRIPEGERPCWKNLVTLVEGPRQRPVVCVHAVGGNVLGYKQLFDEDRLERAVIGIQASGLDGLERPARDLGSMARSYTDQLINAGFKGPFTLLGGSMGGTIALEMAACLMERGQSVDWVVMLDTLGPGVRTAGSPDESGLASERIYRSLRARSRYYWKNLRVHLYQLLGQRIPYRLRPFLIENENKLALARHRERRYGGNVLLLRAPLDWGGEYSDPMLGWNTVLTGKIIVRYIRASHKRFLESEKTRSILNEFFAAGGAND